MFGKHWSHNFKKIRNFYDNIPQENVEFKIK